MGVKHKKVTYLLLFVFALILGGCVGSKSVRYSEKAQNKVLLAQNLINFLVQNWNNSDPAVQKQWREKYESLVKMAAFCLFNTYPIVKAPYCKYLATEANILKEKKQLGIFYGGFEDDFLKRNYSQDKPLIVYSTYPHSDPTGTGKMIVDAILLKKSLNVPLVFVLRKMSTPPKEYAKFVKKIEKNLQKKKFPMCFASDIKIEHISLLTDNVSIRNYLSPQGIRTVKFQCYLPIRNKDYFLERDFPIYNNPHTCKKIKVIKILGKTKKICPISNIDFTKVNDALPIIKWMHKEINLRKKYGN